jgi:hypothetical protein
VTVCKPLKYHVVIVGCPEGPASIINLCRFVYKLIWSDHGIRTKFDIYEICKDKCAEGINILLLALLFIINYVIGCRLAQYDGNIDFLHKDWATSKYDCNVNTVLSLATALTNRMVGLKLHKYASTAQVLLPKVICD